jgi:hypothetical protein
LPRDGLCCSFAQRWIWFLEQLAADNSAYNMLGGMRLSGQLTIRCAGRTINEIIAPA